MLEFPSDVTRIAMVGDLHCDYKYAVKTVHYSKKNGAQVIIQLGDFGYNFPDGYLNVIQEACDRLNMLLLFVDGNHENFDWLYSQPVSPDGVRRLRERLWHLPRNFRWSWQGVNFLALGGAHSVDRQWRDPGVSWWWQEHLTYAEMQKAIEDGQADVMVCHDCPASANLPLPDESWIPQSELLAAEMHRQILQEVVNVVKPKHLFHGHYHMYYETTAKAGDGICNIHSLSCNGEMFDKAISIHNVADLT